MEQTLSAAGVSSPCADDTTPSSEGGLDLSVLEWMKSSEEHILSRSAAAAASAVTSRRRPQSLRSSRIPLPRPQSTELPQSLHSYLSTVFDVDWSIISPTTEDALFTSKKSSTPRLSPSLSALSNVSSTLSSPLADTAKGLKTSSPEPELSANPIFPERTRHNQTQDVQTGLQGRHSLADLGGQQSSVGLCESKSSSYHEEGVANDTSLFSWEQSALNLQTSGQKDQSPQQHSKDRHQRQDQHQHQHQQEQHIHNHIHIHVHTYASPSPDSEDDSVVYSYSQPPRPQSSRYPSQPLLPPPPASIQRKHQHQQKASYPSIAVAGPLAPQSSSQPLTNSSSFPQYPPEKALSSGHDHLYLATTPSPPEPTRSRYPRSPPPPPYTPSPALTNDTAEINGPMVFPHPMKQAPQAPRHMQSAAARKEYQRYEEQQKMFVRDEEPKETGSQGFLRMLTRQSSKRKPTKVASISAPLSVAQPAHWQDQDHARSLNRLSLASMPNTKVGVLKAPQRPLPPMTHPPSTEAFSYYPSRSAPAPFSLTAQQ